MSKCKPYSEAVCWSCKENKFRIYFSIEDKAEIRCAYCGHEWGIFRPEDLAAKLHEGVHAEASCEAKEAMKRGRPRIEDGGRLRRRHTNSWLVGHLGNVRAMMDKFPTIVADPPWDVMRPNGWGRRDLNHQSQSYPVMTVEQIAKLPVETLASEVAFIFIWTVNKFVEQTYSICRGWGFYPTTLLTWCKQPHGMGPGGHFASTSEFILYGRRGSCGEFGRKRVCDRSWFDWPKRSQSEKPEHLQDLIEQHFPGPYLELFARRTRLGWSAWGNEVPEIKIAL